MAANNSEPLRVGFCMAMEDQRLSGTMATSLVKSSAIDHRERTYSKLKSNQGRHANGYSTQTR